MGNQQRVLGVEPQIVIRPGENGQGRVVGLIVAGRRAEGEVVRFHAQAFARKEQIAGRKPPARAGIGQHLVVAIQYFRVRTPQNPRILRQRSHGTGRHQRGQIASARPPNQVLPSAPQPVGNRPPGVGSRATRAWLAPIIGAVVHPRRAVVVEELGAVGRLIAYFDRSLPQGNGREGFLRRDLVLYSPGSLGIVRSLLEAAPGARFRPGARPSRWLFWLGSASIVAVSRRRPAAGAPNRRIGRRIGWRRFFRWLAHRHPLSGGRRGREPKRQARRDRHTQPEPGAHGRR